MPICERNNSRAAYQHRLAENNRENFSPDTRVLQCYTYSYDTDLVRSIGHRFTIRQHRTRTLLWTPLHGLVYMPLFIIPLALSHVVLTPLITTFHHIALTTNHLLLRINSKEIRLFLPIENCPRIFY